MSTGNLYRFDGVWLRSDDGLADRYNLGALESIHDDVRAGICIVHGVGCPAVAFPPAAHTTSAVPPGVTYTPQQRQALDHGLDAAWLHIVSNPNCVSFLSGNPQGGYAAGVEMLAAKLSETAYQFADLGSDTAAQTVENGTAVTINTEGAFLADPEAGMVSISLPDSSSYFMQNVGAFQADSAARTGARNRCVTRGRTAQSGQCELRNTQAILDNCFSRHGGVYK